MIRLTDYFIMTHTSKPSFSEGLTNDLTALGIYHIYMVYLAGSYSQVIQQVEIFQPQTQETIRGENDT